MRFELINEVGRGAFGVVYRARDRETGDLVALKQLRPEIAGDAGFIDRFKNELLLTRKITHRNVCRVYDLYREGEGVFISMEFVEGESLRARLRREKRLAVPGALAIISQMIDGLEEAHRQHIVHRDLKPENVMIAADGTVKIMDFGIARATYAEATTLAGMVGTPSYMSPEQALGQAVDERSDIYALGLILYDMVCGQRAFAGDSAVSVAMKHVNEVPVAPGRYAPGLPAFVEAAILKCMEKDRDHRFASLDEMRVALREPAVDEARAPQDSVAGGPERQPRWSMWKIGTVAAGVLAGVVLLGAAGGFTMFTTADGPDTPVAQVVTTASAPVAPAPVPIANASAAAQVPGPVGTSAPGAPTLAVLDFANLQKDSRNAHLELGIAEAFTSSFVRSRRFRVVERAQIDKVLTELRFNRTEAVDQATAQQVGRLVGAQYLVLGSFQVFGGQTRINARLLRVETGEVVQTDAVTGDSSQALTLPDRLADGFLSRLQ